MTDDELLVKQGQRRADLIIADLVGSLAPSAGAREKYYPPINPRLYSRHDADVARRRILQRDNYTCIYCGCGITDDPQMVFHIDHIAPLARGGTDCISNLVTACACCNESKGDRPLSSKEQRRVLDEVKRRNAQHGIDATEHLHVLGAARREKRARKGK